MAGAFGLTPVHEKAIVAFLKFSRYKREERLRAVDGAFDDMKESRLDEDCTYSGQEVEAMVEGLKHMLHANVESELIDSDHTQVVLLCQLFQKAQEWKLVLEPKISELENRQLLEEIAQFELSEFSKASSGGEALPAMKSKLNPLDESGPAALMRSEIRQLEEENRDLRSKLKALQEKASSASQEVDTLSGTLASTKDALSKATTSSKTSDAEVDALQKAVSTATGEISKLKVSASGADRASYQETEDRLASALHELLSVRSDLDTARQDLEKKFSESNAYNNLKKILTTKNDQIKELRSKIAKYEGDS